MDPILTLIVIEQTIATIIIAAAIVVYSRATTRVLEAHVEPAVHVTVTGGPEANTLAITNDAKCAISNLNVIISVGCVWGSQPYSARHCLYFGAWPTLVSASTQTAVEQPLRPAGFSNAELPVGASLNMNDIFIEYSFTRTADRRRYAFGYQICVFEQTDGKLVYVQMGQPKMLSQAMCAYESKAGMPTPIGSVAIPAADTHSMPSTDLNGADAAYCIG